MGRRARAACLRVLLGMYLGDGHIVRAKKSYRLQIYLHVDNRAVIERVVRVLKTLLPGRPIAIVRHGRSAVAVSTYFAAWPWLFPQHGRGRKHTRPIVLEEWQQGIVAQHPEEVPGARVTLGASGGVVRARFESRSPAGPTWRAWTR